MKNSGSKKPSSTRRTRDDFPASVRQALAERVVYRCSKPDCRHVTIGADTSNSRGRTRIGIAAHITAAAPGGPRYDSELTPEERASAENGIWLCQSCARIIDATSHRYEASVLRAWKRDAERATELEVLYGTVEDYAADIARLVLHTERSIASIARVGVIETPDAGPVHIERAVVEIATTALRSQSVLVVSEAGAGKSVVLGDVVQRLRDEGERVIFLDATDARLVDARSLFGLRHGLEDVLQAWREGDRPGYVVIDGLDAMRSVGSFDALQRLIQDLQSGTTPWHILAATRDYDLESATQLQSLFWRQHDNGVPQEHTDQRFSRVSHVAVRRLATSELHAVLHRSSVMSSLWASASDDLKRVLCNPFNLSIAARIAKDKALDSLRSVRTRAQLLDLWWDMRVTGSSTATTRVEREEQIRDLARIMLATKKLRVPNSDLTHTGAAFGYLHSDGVLTSVDDYGQETAFAHAIVFDYAVFRLLLQTTTLSAFLGADGDLALFALPSLRLRLSDLWLKNRVQFNEQVRSLFSTHQRRTIQMSAAQIAIAETRTVDDILALLEPQDRTAATVLLYLVRALIHARQNGLPLVGDDAGPWSALTLALANFPRTFEHDGLLLLHECLTNGTPTQQQLDELAHAARLHMKRTLQDDGYEAVLARMAISSFMKTYDVASDLAAPYLRRLLERNRIARLGRYELQPLAYDLRSIHTPDALLNIYTTLLSNDVGVGEGRVDIGRRSAVMSMVQDARQTLSTARWALGERYELFLGESPEHAFRALVSALDNEAQDRRPFRTMSVETPDATIILGIDSSNIWDSSVYQHEPWYVMLRAFENHLKTTLENADLSLFQMAYRILTEAPHGMHLWRILFSNAGGHAETARLIAPMITSAVLTTLELSEPSAAFLRSGYELLTEDERRAIDAAIIGIVHDALDERLLEYRERRRGVFAADLPVDAIATPALRELAEEHRHASEALTERERKLLLEGSARSGTWAMAPRLSEGATRAGASDALARAIDAARPLITPSQRGTNESAQVLIDAIEQIEAAATGAPDEACAHAYDVICSIIRSGLEGKVFAEDQLPRVLSLLSLGIRIQDEPSDDAIDDRDDETLSWGSPWRFADAAQAYGELIGQSTDSRILEGLRALAAHPRANVRFLANASAQRYAASEPGIALEFAERAARDPAMGVVHAGLQIGFQLYNQQPDDVKVAVRRMVYSAYDRLRDREGGGEGTIRNVLQAMMYFRHNAGDDGGRLDLLVHDPWRWPHVGALFANFLADALGVEGTDYTLVAGLLGQIVTNCASIANDNLRDHGNDLAAYPDAVRVMTEASLRILRVAAERIYFASGAYDSNTLHQVGTIDSTRFEALCPILETLATVPFSGLAYNVVRTLNGAVNAFPEQALHIASRACLTAREIASDHFAEDDVREFVMCYVREHRGLLARDPSALARILDIVDLFVDAGWPQWIPVLFELDRIFRE